MPSAGNPQSWNRYTYVGNNPINFGDPTGHMETGACGYGGQDCSGKKGVTIFEKPDETGDSPKPKPRVKDGSKNNQSDKGTPTPETNICKGQPPYISKYECGVKVTDPTYLKPLNNPDPIVGDDTFTDFYWPGKMEENQSAGSRSVNAFFLGLDAFYWIHHNSQFHGRLTGQYTQAVIPFVRNTKTGYLTVHGMFVVNKTSEDLSVKTIIVDNTRYDFPPNRITSGSASGYGLPQLVVPSNIPISIQINIRSSSLWGAINYNEPIYP